MRPAPPADWTIPIAASLVDRLEVGNERLLAPYSAEAASSAAPNVIGDQPAKYQEMGRCGSTCKVHQKASPFACGRSAPGIWVTRARMALPDKLVLGKKPIAGPALIISAKSVAA